MIRAKPIAELKHFLQLDEFTYQHSLPQIISYEKRAYQDCSIMSRWFIRYENFVVDDCPYCYVLQNYLQNRVFMYFYPELAGTTKDLLDRDNQADLYNLYNFQHYHQQPTPVEVGEV